MNKNMEEVKMGSPKGEIVETVHYSEEEVDRLAVLCPGFLDSKDYAHLVELAKVLSRN
ncbi:hypothetical protein GW923_03590 [Candidatus Pacearchaeota archaeon]|nr:hypothetical protein [Candidatus Pacearchaeota archaeon]